MHTTMLKLSPTLHPPSSVIKKPQTPCTNFPKILRITNKKPFHISLCLKDPNANLAFKPAPVLTTDDKLEQLHVSAFEPIFSAVKWVFSSVIKLVSSERSSFLALAKKSAFVEENDLILFEHNGKDIVGVVQHVVDHFEMGLMETTLLCELGLLENLKIDRRKVINLTLPNEEFENMWNIYTSVECMDNDVRNMVAEIKQILNAHDELKFNSEYNLVTANSGKPGAKITVVGFVTCSQLKTPHFHHYMEVRRKTLSEIDEIRIKHGGSKVESSALGN